jgi:hypothetical protein
MCEPVPIRKHAYNKRALQSVNAGAMPQAHDCGSAGERRHSRVVKGCNVIVPILVPDHVVGV